MNKLLLYVDDNRVAVIGFLGDEAEQALVDFGPDFGNWPEDFGAYSQETGFWVWEGTIEDDQFKGEWRQMNEGEWVHLKREGKAWL